MMQINVAKSIGKNVVKVQKKIKHAKVRVPRNLKVTGHESLPIHFALYLLPNTLYKNSQPSVTDMCIGFDYVL